MLKFRADNRKERDMQRRDFLKYSAALSVASALPLWSRSLLAAERPALPIPPLVSADAQNHIQLTVQAGSSTFAGKQATTWGYNGSLLGPAIQLRQGKPLTYPFAMRWRKRQPYTGTVWKCRATLTAGRRA